MNDDYRLLDSGDQKKLEQFGPYIIERPCSQAVWRPRSPELWNEAHASFSREKGARWQGKLPESWVAQCGGVKFKLAPTDFGHLGVFPEHQMHWKFVESALTNKPASVLNLFAYSGGLSLAAARTGSQVVHLDASKGMVGWARENAALNQLESCPIRWIIDDVHKFLKREIRRENRYDAIILDPPSFGRGAKGELFKIEEDLPPLLELCRDLLSEKPRFVLLTCHTPAFSQTVLGNLLEEVFPKAYIEAGETLLKSETSFNLPCGHFARALYD